MLNPYTSAFLLALEAQKVIELRLVRIAWGGAEGRAEIASMVQEKVAASMEMTRTLLAGGSPEKVITRYREIVADNTRRLSA